LLLEEESNAEDLDEVDGECEHELAVVGLEEVEPNDDHGDGKVINHAKEGSEPVEAFRFGGDGVSVANDEIEVEEEDEEFEANEDEALCAGVVVVLVVVVQVHIGHRRQHQMDG